MIIENTFAAACYEQNSLVELFEAEKSGPDATDCATWGISAVEWRESIELAMAHQLADDFKLFGEYIDSDAVYSESDFDSMDEDARAKLCLDVIVSNRNWIAK